jgi:putative nucleotidyltransferase with HDIG domain
MADYSKLVQVPIDSFRGVTRDIGFDVYIKLGEENVAHVFSKTTGLDYMRLANYIRKGVTNLLIRAEDVEAYQALVLRPADEIFNDPATTHEKRIAVLLNMTEQNMTEVFSQVPVRKETIADTQKLIGKYVGLMGENPHSLALILKLVSQGEYLYYHSIAVSIFSLFIAKAAGIFDRETIEIIGLGGFLHDVGCTQVPEEILNCEAEYGPKEWGEMHKHPRLGLEMLSVCKHIPEEVRYIVYQHHEQLDGAGYPNAIGGTAIFPPVRIVALADAFSALISKRPHRPAFTAEAAIEILRKDPGKFDRTLVDLLASIIRRQKSQARAA